MNEGNEENKGNEDNLDLTTLNSNKLDYVNASEGDTNIKTIDSNKWKSMDTDGYSDDESKQSNVGNEGTNAIISDELQVKSDTKMSELN